ncbi:MAG: choice-of-anchor tandem repeat NxxGxxAF-containing protein, partial [Acidobacteriota bacterium]
GEAQVFSEHYYPSPINERGEVAFLSRVGVGAGIFVLRSTGIELIAIDGKPSPVAGAKYLGFGNRTPAINDKGDVVFSGFYDGPNAGRALFYKPVGQPTKLLLTSTDKTLKYKFTDFMNPEINNRGDIAFVGRMEGIRYGIFVKTAKGIEDIAISGELAPGLKPGEEFNNFAQQPQINDRGEVVFYAQLKNATVGVFIKDSKGLRPYIMRGDKVPFAMPTAK